MASTGQIIASGIGGLIGAQGTKDQTTTQKPFHYAGQQAAIEQYLQRAREQYRQGGREYYPGQTLADLDPLQIQGQNAALGNVNAQSALGQMGAMANARMMGGGANRIGGFQLADQIGFGLDPSLQQAVTNPIMRDLQQRVLPSMDLQATQQGAFGGSRAQQMKGRAGAEATERMTEALSRANLQARQQSIGQRAGDISAQLSGRTQDINQNQLANQAMSNAQAYQGQAMNGLNQGAQTMMNVGNQRQQYNQQQIGDAQARFDFGQNEYVDNLSRLGDRLTQPSFGGTTKTIQGQGGSAANIAGGALAGWNLFAPTPVTPAPYNPNQYTTQGGGAGGGLYVDNSWGFNT